MVTLQIGWWHVGLAVLLVVGAILSLMWVASRLVGDMHGGGSEMPTPVLAGWLVIVVGYVALWGWLT